MFGSVRLRNIRLTVFSLVCLALFVAVCLLALRAGAPDTVTVGGESYSLRTEDETDIAAFLAVCGYDGAELLTEQKITVPKHWNETYIEYNALQKAQGFDLVPYKGKEAVQRTYAVGDDRRLTLLIGDKQIIGGHICGSDGDHMGRLTGNGQDRG